MYVYIYIYTYILIFNCVNKTSFEKKRTIKQYFNYLTDVRV